MTPTASHPPGSPSVAECFDRWAAICLVYYRRADRHPGDFVFRIPNARSKTPQVIPKRRYVELIHQASRRAGVPRWHPHQLRHWAATEVRRQLDLDSARGLLGHSDSGTTELYARRDQEAARRAVEALERALGPPPVPPSAPPPESDPR